MILLIYKSRNLFQLFNVVSLLDERVIYKSRNLFQLFNELMHGGTFPSTKVEIYFSYSTTFRNILDIRIYQSRNLFQLFNRYRYRQWVLIYQSRNLFQLFNSITNSKSLSIYQSRNLFQLFNSYFVLLHNFKSNNQFIFSIFYTNFQFIVK